MMGLGSTLLIHFNPGGLVGNKAAEKRTTFSILVDEDVENEKKICRSHQFLNREDLEMDIEMQ